MELISLSVNLDSLFSNKNKERDDYIAFLKKVEKDLNGTEVHNFLEQLEEKFLEKFSI